MVTTNELLPRLMQVESAGNPNALSPKGAAGLYQIMPATARDPGYGVKPLQGWDGNDPRTASPEEQKRFASDYLAAMAAVNGGDVRLALASYNAGPGAVQKAGGIPNIKETQDYVTKIMPTSQENSVAQPTTAPSTPTDWRSRAQAVNADVVNVNSPAPSTQAPTTPQAAPVASWRTRAQPVQAQAAPTQGVGSWRANAKPVEPQKPPEPSYAQRLGADIQKRGAQARESQAAYDRGEQSLIETRFQQFGKAGAGTIADVVGTTVGSAYRNLVPDAIQRGVSAAGEYVSDSAVGDVAKDYAGVVGEKYGEFASENPRAARNIESAVNVASLLPIGKAAAAATPVAAKGVSTAARLGAKTSEKLGTSSIPKPRPPKPELGARAVSMKAEASAAFKQADELGETFNPAELADPLRKEIDTLKPKPINGVLTSEEKKLAAHLSEYDKLSGAKLSLEDIKRIDEGITQKINANFVDPRTGQVDASGRTLAILQTKLRNLVDDIPDNAGNDALTNGRRLWKGQIMLNELDTIAERASMSKSPGDALRTGYKNLYMDKDRIRGWPQGAKDLLKQAATPTITDDALGLIASRLPAMIMGGTGNIAGATTAHVAGMAGRGIKAGLAGRQGAKIQDFIVKDTMSGLREVKPKAPPKQLLLAAPDKMSKMGMSDKEISIAQKLGARKPASGADVSGAPVKPPVSYATQLQDSLVGIKAGQFKNMSAKLTSGELSQNKFVEQAAKAFNLTPTKARQLAKEIKTYGAPKPKELTKTSSALGASPYTGDEIWMTPKSNIPLPKEVDAALRKQMKIEEK